MRIDLTGKVVLVTGAAKGIGRATALAFAEAGATVAANDLPEARWEPIPAGPLRNLTLYRGDVAVRSEVIDLFAAVRDDLGAVDILVNNAGITLPRAFLELTEADWDRVLTVNLKSMFLCCQAALPAMVERGEGVIINVASELAYLGRAGFAPYAAAKGGVLSLTRSLAREFAPAVRVNAIAPGPVETDLLMSEIRTAADLEREKDLPMRRLGRPEEVAATAVFLAAPAAGFYCGDVLSPNGGVLMR